MKQGHIFLFSTLAGLKNTYTSSRTDTNTPSLEWFMQNRITWIHISFDNENSSAIIPFWWQGTSRRERGRADRDVTSADWRQVSARSSSGRGRRARTRRDRAARETSPRSDDVRLCKQHNTSRSYTNEIPKSMDIAAIQKNKHVKWRGAICGKLTTDWSAKFHNTIMNVSSTYDLIVSTTCNFKCYVLLRFCYQ